MEEIRKIFEEVDVDGNKRIAYTEFIAAAMDQKKKCEEESYWVAFNVFDHDGSGMISKKELLQVLQNKESGGSFQDSLKATSDDIARCIASCDNDGDGEMDFEEFVAMLKG